MAIGVSSCPRCGRKLPADSATAMCAQCTQSLDSGDATLPVGRPASGSGSDVPTIPAVPGEWTVPPELGAVRIIEQIGRGASGLVYRGYDRVLGRAVAVKFLSSLSLSNRERQQWFLDEARAAAAVQHPNLVQIHQAAMAGDTPCLVLEYVPGVTLATIVRQCGPMSVPALSAVLVETAAAVAALHQNGILHRDLKPGNIMLDREGHVRVTDLGVALQRPASAPAGAVQGALAGTPAYMAPEMFEGRASPRSDVYAMGITAFELLAGRIPFDGTLDELRQKHRDEPLPVSPLLDRGASASLVEVIERAAHKQPLFRYKSASEFARAFAQAAGTTDLEKSRRDLSLMVAHCTGGDERSRKPSDPTPQTTTLRDALEQMVQSKRQRRSSAEPIRIELPPPPVLAGDIMWPDAPPAVSAPVRAESLPVLPVHEGAGESAPKTTLPEMQYISRENRHAVFASLRRRGGKPIVGIVIGVLAAGVTAAVSIEASALAAWITRSFAPRAATAVGWIAFVLVWISAIAVAVPIASRRLRPRLMAELTNRGLCSECGYDLSQNTTGVCPECGAPARTQSGEDPREPDAPE